MVFDLQVTSAKSRRKDKQLLLSKRIILIA